MYVIKKVVLFLNKCTKLENNPSNRNTIFIFLNNYIILFIRILCLTKLFLILYYLKINEEFILSGDTFVDDALFETLQQLKDEWFVLFYHNKK